MPGVNLRGKRGFPPLSTIHSPTFLLPQTPLAISPPAASREAIPACIRMHAFDTSPTIDSNSAPPHLLFFQPLLNSPNSHYPAFLLKFSHHHHCTATLTAWTFLHIWCLCRIQNCSAHPTPSPVKLSSAEMHQLSLSLSEANINRSPSA